MLEVYIILLHKLQLHVSALHNGHFRLYMTYLVSSYTRLIWAVYSGEVGVEVGTRSRMCQSLGGVGTCRDSAIIYYV